MAQTILVLDDDRLFCASVGEALEAVGFRVVIAGTGAEGKNRLRAESPALLVVDGLLPDVRGTEWIADVRGQGCTAPILFVSAFWRDFGSSRALFEQLQVSDVVAKPVSPQALAEKVQLELLRLQSPQQALHRLHQQVQEQPDLNPLPYLEDPREAALLRIDAARTLSSKVRELSDALGKARARREAVSLAEARLRVQKLSQLARTCGFSDLSRSILRIESGLQQLSNPESSRDEQWAPLTQEVEEALHRTRRLTRGQEQGRVLRKLLVVEADPQGRTHLQALFPPSLCELRMAEHPHHALQLAQEEAPDAALLSDAELGFGGVLELIPALRSLADCENLPLGVVTSQPRAESIREAKARGVGQVLGRPWVRDEALSAVCTLLGVSAPAQQRVLVLTANRELGEEVCFHLARYGMEGAVGPVASAPQQLGGQHFEGVVLDGQSERSALEWLTWLRTFPRWQQLPVVMWVGADSARRLEALEAGADDVLSAPASFEELVARVRIGVQRAQARRSQLGEDALTGYLSRPAYLRALGQRLADARRHTRKLLLALVHLEGLEEANATGPETGDALLTGLSQLLAARFRAEDLRGRWRGATLAFCFQSPNGNSLQAVFARLAHEFRSMRFGPAQGAKAGGDFTVGSATFPTDGTTLAELLLCAESRLTEARRARGTARPPPAPARGVVLGRTRTPPPQERSGQ